ncbi:MAG: FtsX-like permease family protein [Candidatus Heimdallarchaeota archaeon]|nr:FtsX-like permease family protein [Candidatus Heimdallarchaeota archaeon]
MVSIARKNLAHDKRRFIITVIGISASLLLIFFGLGMNFGTINSMLSITDHSQADIWVVNEGVESLLDEPSYINESLITEISNIEGVKSVHSLIYTNIMLAKNDTRLASILVGTDFTANIIEPWKLLSGNDDGLIQEEDVIIVDEIATRNFNEISVGDTFKINNFNQEIIGISKGARSFIYPFVLTSLENAKKIARMGNTTNYLLVETNTNHPSEQVKNEINKIAGLEALLQKEIRKNTILYMQFEAGMGLGTFLFAIVGLFVAIVIIALTTYTSTMERIPDFATLKAIGASQWDIRKILLEMISWGVILGYILGLITSLLGALLINSVTLMPVYIPVALAVGTFFVTYFLSLLSGFIPMRVIKKIDPAIVFRR